MLRLATLLPLLLPAAAFVPTALRAAVVTRRDPACRATSLPVASEPQACGAAGVLDEARAVVARAEEEAQRQKLDQQSANNTPDSSGGVAAGSSSGFV